LQAAGAALVLCRKDESR